ncbi:MAG TPA: hypothetical protein VLM39_04680 [Ignavibacteriaceae bacterium]|nr:hypothetical protein [Ignavibacteriaceae bacterium]
MIDSTTLFSYIAACAVIIFSPGPAQALVLAVTILIAALYIIPAFLSGQEEKEKLVIAADEKIN